MAKFLAFVAVLAFALVGRFLAYDGGQKVNIPEGQVIFEATIKEEPKVTEKWQIVTLANIKMYTSNHPKYEVGERLRVEGKAEEGRIFYPKLTKVSKVSNVSNVVGEFRNRIAGNIDRLLPGSEAALVKGMVLGVDDLSQDLRDKLISTGTIHVVVVSGQNLAIVAGMFLAFVKVLGRKFAVILAVIAVFLYALLTGFAPPVTRAALMVLASSVAVLAGRELWPIWSLVLAAYLIVFINPAALFEVSFQLTFAATLGIMTLGKRMGNVGIAALDVSDPVARSSHPTSAANSNSFSIQKLFLGLRALDGTPSARATRSSNNVTAGGIYPERKSKGYVFGNWRSYPLASQTLRVAAVPISAYIFTAPFVYFYFGRISWVGPLVNVLISELVAPIMVLGFVLAGLSLISMPLAQIAAYLAYVPAWFFLAVVSLFSS